MSSISLTWCREAGHLGEVGQNLSPESWFLQNVELDVNKEVCLAEFGLSGI